MTFKVRFQTIEINFIFTTYANDPNFVVKVMAKGGGGRKKPSTMPKTVLEYPNNMGQSIPV